MDLLPLRILIVRLSALGDAVHGLPLLATLRERFPDARIGWAAEDAALPLLRDNPALNQVHRIPRRWLRDPGCWRRLRQEFAAEAYDTVLDVQGLSKSALLARFLSGARRRIGFARPDAREVAPWFYTDRIRPPGELLHVVDRQLRLLEVLAPGSVSYPTPETAEFPLPDYAAARKAVRMELDGWLGGLSLPFAVMSAGGGWPAKLWPVERFAEVAADLWTRRGMATLVTWHCLAEQHRAEAVVAAARMRLDEESGEAVRMASPRDLPGLVETLRAATVAIGPDSGPLHLAGAAGTPTVGFFGPTRAERTGVYGPAVRHASLTGHLPGRAPVSPSRPPPRGANFRDPACIATLDAAAVLEAVDRVAPAGGWCRKGLDPC